MQKKLDLSDIKVCVKGGGDLASGVAWRLYQCGFKVFITEIAQPTAVGRNVAFCEAIYEGRAEVEGAEALLVSTAHEVFDLWERRKIPILVDPGCEARNVIRPNVMVDAIIAKENIGTSMDDAPLVIALGPGFLVGRDAHFIIETSRGHNLGRLLTSGSAKANTGVPGPVQGITTDRVLRSPAEGLWQGNMDIGDFVKKGDTIGSVTGLPVRALIDGVIRGMIRHGILVSKGLKVGDIDPRGIRQNCFTISEKALAIGGGVIEGVFRFLGRKLNNKQRPFRQT
jgi:xanthine dehydrogenase accessory factor